MEYVTDAQVMEVVTGSLLGAIISVFIVIWLLRL